MKYPVDRVEKILFGMFLDRNPKYYEYRYEETQGLRDLVMLAIEDAYLISLVSGDVKIT